MSYQNYTTMKKFILYSLIFWSITFYVISFFKSGVKNKVHYYHAKNFDSSLTLFSDLLEQKTTDGIFEWCCDCIQFYAKELGFTYEELNIVIFVVLQPAMIIYLISCLVFNYFSYRNKILNFTRV